MNSYGEQVRIEDPCDDSKIANLFRKGNLPLAEMLLRTSLEKDPTNPKTLYYLGLIASAVNLPQFAIDYFSEAARLAPDWELPRINLERIGKQLKEAHDECAANGLKAEHADTGAKFLLVKAWGNGFWSDVSHVLGQLLVAEITGRIPVVHWGSNSLFGDGTGSNAFEFYFEAISDVGVGDLQKEDFDFWPPKWNRSNLTADEINKMAGPFSRVAGLYLLSRPEKVIVSDFYTGVIDLKPWIPVGHHLHGMSVDALYRYLVRRYLHPRKEITDEVDRFYARHLASTDFIAVHVRGSDKVVEMKILDTVNERYKELIDRCLSTYICDRIFLMTDDSRVLDYFRKLYGNKIIATDCQRTNSMQGIHHQNVFDRRRLGAEVMVDAYLAARAKAFIGNGFSNPSLIVRYLKDWSEGDVYLLGKNLYHRFNTFLHNW